MELQVNRAWGRRLAAWVPGLQERVVATGNHLMYSQDQSFIGGVLVVAAGGMACEPTGGDAFVCVP